MEPKIVSIFKIKAIFTERYYDKHDILKIGSQEFIVTTNPIRVDGGWGSRIKSTFNFRIC